MPVALPLLKCILSGIVVGIPPGGVFASVVLLAKRRRLREVAASAAAVASADALHASIACAGNLAIVRVYQSLGVTGAIAATLILLAAAYGAFRRARGAAGTGRRPVYRDALGMMLLALAAPGTMAGFVACFAVLGLASSVSLVIVVIGAFIGSFVWWMAVALVSRSIRSWSGASAPLEYATCLILLVAALGSARGIFG